MPKRKAKSSSVVDSDSDSSDLDSDVEFDSPKKTTKRSRHSKTKNDSDDVSGLDSSSDDSDEEWTVSKHKKSDKKKPGKRATKKPARAAVHLSSSSESSESDASPDGGDSGDELEEDLIGDDADRAWLEQLTEKEREQELYNRIEQKRAEKKRREIEKKLKKIHKTRGAAGDSTSTPKFSSPPSHLEEVNRSKERRTALDKKGEKKKAALKALTAKREEKKQKEEKRRQAVRVEDIFSDSSSSDDESRDDGESALKAVGARARAYDVRSDLSSEEGEIRAVKKSEPIQTKEQLSKIKLSRDRLARWCFMPFFKDIAVGCYVRIGIGNNDTNQPVYRVAQIADVVETPKTYHVICANTRFNTRTNKGLLLRHGKADRVYRLEFISNHPFTDSEFNKWKDAMAQANLSLPTTDQAEKKAKAIEEANTYSLKEEDVEHIVREKQRFRRNPINYATRKQELLLEKETAYANEDFAAVQRLEDELEEIELRAKELHHNRSSVVAPIAEINKRNREDNMSKLEEMMAMERDKVANDPFTRRATRPLIAKVSKDKPASSQQPDSAQKPPASGQNNEGGASNSALPSHISAAGMYAALDVDLNLSIPAFATATPSSLPVSNVSGTAKTSDTGNPNKSSSSNRRSLNLDAYKQKKGLI